MALPLAAHRMQVAATFAKAGRFLVASDFDGTLARIAPHPNLAHLPESVRAKLNSIASRKNLAVAVVSGRNLIDVRERVGIPDIYYAGNHGLEISGIDFSFVEPNAAQCQPVLVRLASRLTLQLSRIPGCFVELKKFSASVHYRQVDETAIEEVLAIVNSTASPDEQFLRISHGRMVVELRPRSNWHKGDAIRTLARHLQIEEEHILYLGDDWTDEDAFESLPTSLTIKVAGHLLQQDLPLETRARYWLQDPNDVEEFLSWLMEPNPDRPTEEASKMELP